MNDNFWLETLTKTHEINIGYKSFIVKDFHTSESPQVIASECNRDIHGIAVADLKPRSIIVDIGANVGIWSMMAATLFPDSLVVAIEPMPHNFKHLVENIELNKIQNIKPIQTAVSNIDGTILLRQHPLNSGSASKDLDRTFPEFAVTSIKLDTLLSQFRADFIKMDIEGAEYDTLYQTTKWSEVGFLSVELHNQFNDPELVVSRTMQKNLEEFLGQKLGPRVNIIYP